MTTERKITLSSGAEFKISYEGAEAGHPDVQMFLQVANEIDMLRAQISSCESSRDRMKLLLNKAYKPMYMVNTAACEFSPEDQAKLADYIKNSVQNIELKIDHGDGDSVQVVLTKTRLSLHRLTGAALQVIDSGINAVDKEELTAINLLEEAVKAISVEHKDDFDYIVELRDVLSAARNGLRWYRDTYPDAESGADDEMQAQIEKALGEESDSVQIESTIEDLFDGLGASEDHQYVIDWFVKKGLSRKLATRVHEVLAWHHCTPTRDDLLAVIKSKMPAKYASRQNIVARLAIMAEHERLWRTSSSVEWRRLALQFDGHRMQAMELLKLGVISLRGGNAAALTSYLKEVETFVAAPPLSGQAVLLQHIAEYVTNGAPRKAVEWETWNAAIAAAVAKIIEIDDGDAPAYADCRSQVRDLLKPAA